MPGTRVLAAQRYTKVLGRFARLTLRDGRDAYLRYLPRVVMLLTDALDAEPLLRSGRSRHADDHLPFANAAQLLEDMRASADVRSSLW